MPDFLHIADVHLGNQQYGSKERFNDFGRAYLAAVDYALEHAVQFVIISGDLFNKSSIEPATLMQAMNGLKRLKEAGIPVVVVAGNHDRVRYKEGESWLGFLSEEDLIYLLEPDFDDNGEVILKPWDGERGAYVDLAGIRIYGLPYLGASSQVVLSGLALAIANQPRTDIGFTILMGHFGLDGQMPGVPGGISQSLLTALKDEVDYLALGHWHKPFKVGGWIFNPGSLESCTVTESEWPGGYYHVSTEAGNQKPAFTAKHIPSIRRTFYRLSYQVDACKTLLAFSNGLQKMLDSKRTEIGSKRNNAVIELTLHGIMAFERSALDIEDVTEMVKKALDPLLVRVVNNTRATAFGSVPGEHMDPHELERQTLSELIRQDSRYHANADNWAEVMVEIKTLAAEKNAPEIILQTLRQAGGMNHAA